MKTFLFFISFLFCSFPGKPFCGFYVSKADGTLKNKTSQVILVRDDNRTVLTMYNDFKGDVKDFAMVVPVPVVLQQSDIKVVDARIFETLNDYSKPRLVEYFDQNPCTKYEMDSQVRVMGYGNAKDKFFAKRLDDKISGVTIEASYTVGEYDILILSAKESSGLKNWLNDNGYKIPKGAEEVLDPYIKSNLKFFVVKVNLREKEKAGLENLRPIQIRFNSPKFMLPIRLGMANSDGDQDLLVYAFTRTGRIETTNYRTVAIPTGEKVPLFVQKDFSSFYSNLFQHQCIREDKNIAFVEYAWNVSPSNYIKCDPCVSNPPTNEDLKSAGVWWIGQNKYNEYVNEYDKGNDQVYFTRLHVRYNRKSFPQDLFFQATPNTENFQARYIITHPASGDFTCDAGRNYLKELKERRIREMETLSWLTGKDGDDWNVSFNDEENKNITSESSYVKILAEINKEKGDNELPAKGILLASAIVLGCFTIIRLKNKV